MQAFKKNEGDTENNMELFAPHIPPEVLQMVFHELDFFDLLRCQQVCKTWCACLPGNDPKLRDKLFVNRTMTQNSQDDGEDKEKSGHREVSHTLLLGFDLKARECGVGSRSYLITSPAVIFPGYASLGSRINNASEAITVHPVVKKLHEYLHIIFGSLFEDDDDKQQWHQKYYTRNDLMDAIEAAEQTAKEKNESWKDMLVCVPPLSGIRFGIRVEVHLRRSGGSFVKATERYVRHGEIYTENKGGITLGQVIDVIHEHLEIWATT
ncbi:hypothetical protein COCCADRAFT_41903 [Bipolaris zeicola 26-R-13]|uniref:F-box domain-containing protein n=1 Tax=Cochliobolus carbonum (strain 26-R-13) TaxID=930089 RepID=W6XPZ9_COCC2|nr:uncharacterized protein COCCADRAFT_41903 [Bipolaris zeicola 26-R-13]EUC27350.1 hypothetical protein COCCADRAFT_41903 [Bipolaris zeicola 26-R-13]